MIMWKTTKHGNSLMKTKWSRILSIGIFKVFKNVNSTFMKDKRISKVNARVRSYNTECPKKTLHVFKSLFFDVMWLKYYKIWRGCSGIIFQLTYQIWSLYAKLKKLCWDQSRKVDNYTQENENFDVKKWF